MGPGKNTTSKFQRISACKAIGTMRWKFSKTECSDFKWWVCLGGGSSRRRFVTLRSGFLSNTNSIICWSNMSLKVAFYFQQFCHLLIAKVRTFKITNFAPTHFPGIFFCDFCELWQSLPKNMSTFCPVIGIHEHGESHKTQWPFMQYIYFEMTPVHVWQFSSLREKMSVLSPLLGRVLPKF